MKKNIVTTKPPKILKELPKSKSKYKPNPNVKPLPPKQDQFKDKYLQFYDDIKISSRRYDW